MQTAKDVAGKQPRWPGKDSLESLEMLRPYTGIYVFGSGVAFKESDG